MKATSKFQFKFAIAVERKIQFTLTWLGRHFENIIIRACNVLHSVCAEASRYFTYDSRMIKYASPGLSLYEVPINRLIKNQDGG